MNAARGGRLTFDGRSKNQTNPPDLNKIETDAPDNRETDNQRQVRGFPLLNCLYRSSMRIIRTIRLEFQFTCNTGGLLSYSDDWQRCKRYKSNGNDPGTSASLSAPAYHVRSSG